MLSGAGFVKGTHVPAAWIRPGTSVSTATSRMDSRTGVEKTLVQVNFINLLK